MLYFYRSIPLFVIFTILAFQKVNEKWIAKSHFYVPKWAKHYASSTDYISLSNTLRIQEKTCSLLVGNIKAKNTISKLKSISNPISATTINYCIFSGLHMIYCYFIILHSMLKVISLKRITRLEISIHQYP